MIVPRLFDVELSLEDLSRNFLNNGAVQELPYGCLLIYVREYL
jgi:hypothetical protein